MGSFFTNMEKENLKVTPDKNAVKVDGNLRIALGSNASSHLGVAEVRQKYTNEGEAYLQEVQGKLEATFARYVASACASEHL